MDKSDKADTPAGEASLDDLLQENRTFTPPSSFVEKAQVRDESVYEEAEKDPKFREVRDNYEAFRKLFQAWDDVTEDAYRQYFNRLSK